MILNRINPDMVARGDMLTAEDVLELLAIELIGLVPEDENVLMSSNRGTPIVLENKSRAGLAFRNVAKRLMGETVPFMALEADAGLLDRLSRFIRPGGD